MLVPQMTNIHAEDAAVVIHEPERVEAEPRYAEQGACRSEPSAAAHRGRQAEDGEPSSRREAIVAVAPRSATARIEHEVYSPRVRQLLDAIDHVLGTGIDQSLNATSAKKIVLCRGGDTNHLGADDRREIDDRKPDSPAAEWTSIVSPARSRPIAMTSWYAVR